LSTPRIVLYGLNEEHEQPSGGLLWTFLDRLCELPGGGSVGLERADSDDDFMQAWRLPGGFRLLAQVRADDEPVLAYPVTFDVAFAAMLAWNLGEQTWRTACEWRSARWPDEPDTPPQLIRIAYEPDFSRTDRIGRYADGQFFAIVHGTRSNALGDIGVALLLFDHAGTFTGATIHNDVPLDDADALRERLIGELADVAFGDIAVRTFAVREGDVVWELVDQTEKHGDPRVSFYPMDIMFSPPWDGTYCT
jgi:hypothetical protein